MSLVSRPNKSQNIDQNEYQTDSDDKYFTVDDILYDKIK